MSDQNQDAPEKLIINGQEFDPDEAAEFIEVGRKTKELETKYNTKLDKVWPDYGRTTQTLKQVEQELADAKAQITEFASKKEEGKETPADVQQARDAARKLGIVLKDDLSESGYVRKEDVEKLFEDRKKQDREVERVLSEASGLEKELDGTDGRPRFRKNHVMPFAAQYGYSDLKQAYEDMYADELKGWKDAQVAAAKAKGLKTLGGSATKEPKTPKITDDNFKQALNEALYGGQEE